MSEFYWVRRRSGEWLVAEKRYMNRWFVCGERCIQTALRLDTYRSPKNSNDIVEIGDKVVCPHT